MTAERYVCMHGHFYQPPRENAWLEQIEVQDSAYPYHDWNERIAAECYSPNAESRILDDEGYITKLANNYAKMSFNFGPTLLSWMERVQPSTYEAIRLADRESQALFSGHGSAIAQAYNHLILPLANPRDKQTQIAWGLADFRHRFGREAEGMWLPETAVDIETLEALAERGVKFTILAPRQARRVRQTGHSDWKDVSGERINPRTAYLQNLPSGRSIALFFYDGPIAKAVAFEGILSNGDAFAQRLLGAFNPGQDGPQIVSVAVDGETFGHHHRFGDMALAYAQNYIERNNLARITNYAEYLEKHPPTREVEIVENSSWSCVHGIERWRSDCTCNSGAHPGWNQSWREPLRGAFDWLRDTVAPLYEQEAQRYVTDPWQARDDYISLILDRSQEAVSTFISGHTDHPLTRDETVSLLKLLEMQRHSLLMYTSCGWFFDDLAGIETVQVMQYAGRLAQLAGEVFKDGTEAGLLERLSEAESNNPGMGNGRQVFERYVTPAKADLQAVAAHLAISSIFEHYEEDVRLFCYPIHIEEYQTSEMGKARLALGRAQITSEVTTESGIFTFGVLYFGEHNLNAGVREFRNDEAYHSASKDMVQPFDSADFASVVRELDRNFGSTPYTLKSLFKDEQRKVMESILGSALSEIEQVFRQLYEHHYSPMRFLTEMGNPLPKAFKDAAEFIINSDLRIALSAENMAPTRIETLVADARTWNAELDIEGHGYLLQKTLVRMMRLLFEEPGNAGLLQNLARAVEMSASLPFPLHLGEVQNLYYRLRQSLSNDSAAGSMTEPQREALITLGEQLKVRAP